MNNKILIVVSDYYKVISENLVKGSVNLIKEYSYDFDILYAPGCFEIPYILKNHMNFYNGFVSLGCIIRGETYHFEVIANECGRKIMDLSLEFNKPIGFGILTCETYEQAIVRSDPKQKNKGKEAASACIELLKINNE